MKMRVIHTWATWGALPVRVPPDRAICTNEWRARFEYVAESPEDDAACGCWPEAPRPRHEDPEVCEVCGRPILTVRQ
jgi:hypothetical protein